MIANLEKKELTPKKATMESHELLKELFSEAGIKWIAKELGLSTSLLYKWTQQQPTDKSEQSGARNPLDRILELCRLCGNEKIIHWICQNSDGFFVPNPHVNPEDKIERTVFENTQSMIKEFSDLLNEISLALSDGKGIDLDEAKSIRKEWEALKSQAERFVYACEQDVYNKETNQNNEEK